MWSITTRQPQTLVALFSLVVVGSWLLWMAQFPWQLNSDDAFHFSQALERYSVLEFRPHFPGYPGFYLLSCVSRFFTASDVQAIIAVSVAATAMIPILLAVIGYQLSGSLWVAVSVMLTTISQPVLAGQALSGLTDAPAIMLFFMALVCYFYPTQRSWPVGLFLGLMLATRPSYLPLALAFLPMLVSYQYRGRAFVEAATPILIIGGISALFLLSRDGMAYFDEGVRFTQGHFDIWGNTSAADSSALMSWTHQACSSFGMLVSVVMVAAMCSAPFIRHHKVQQCGWLALSYAAYILVAQNPENVRHLVPVLLLSLVIFYQQLYLVNLSEIRRRILIITITATLVISSIGPLATVVSRDTPIQQAVDYIKLSAENRQVVGTNYSVNLLRNQLKQVSVYDMYYSSSEAQLLANAKQGASVWRMSSSPLKERIYHLKASFMARFPAERSLFLYAVYEPVVNPINNNQNKK
jgi:hypothetical protein